MSSNLHARGVPLPLTSGQVPLARVVIALLTWWCLGWSGAFVTRTLADAREILTVRWRGRGSGGIAI